jgi:hypothetical protein
MFIKYVSLVEKYHLFLLDVDHTENFRQRYEKLQMPNFIQIHPEVAELLYVDERIDGQAENKI